jgi:predicted transcriptional regulator
MFIICFPIKSYDIKKVEKVVFDMMLYQDNLIQLLREKNSQLTVEQARTWVELLWDDFETTYAKAGREYKGPEMTEKVVRQWINHYGDKLHEFVANNPKYKRLFEQGSDDALLH